MWTAVLCHGCLCPQEPGQTYQEEERPARLTCTYVNDRQTSWKSVRSWRQWKERYSLSKSSFGSKQTHGIIRSLTCEEAEILTYHRMEYLKTSLYVYVEGLPAPAAALEAGCVPFNSRQSKSINGRRRWRRERKG